MEKKEGDLKLEFRGTNISLILNSYNDIFSDFDARQAYEEKSLSDDFLVECRRASMDKNDSGFELILFVPKDKRNLNDEFKIKKRMSEHFHKHFNEKDREIKRLKKSGYKWISIGSILMIISALILTYIPEKNLLLNLLEVIMVPAGWFLFWEGLAKVLMSADEIRPEYNFYKKMSRCHVIFRSY